MGGSKKFTFYLVLTIGMVALDIIAVTIGRPLFTYFGIPEGPFGAEEIELFSLRTHFIFWFSMAWFFTSVLMIFPGLLVAPFILLNSEDETSL